MTTDPGVVAARALLDPMPAAYQPLFDRLVAVVSGDSRVRAMWLGGSIARRVADAGSDLDVLLAVSDDAFADFAADWRTWLESVTPVLMAKELPGQAGSFFATTRDCLRLDVVVEPVSQLSETPYRTRTAVLDGDRLSARLPAPSAPPGPDAERVQAIVEEFYRQQVIFPAAVVARQDWLLGVVGVHNTQVMLYQLFVATNEPLPAMGVKQWSSRLTASQRGLLAALPSPQPDRESVVGAMQAVRGTFRHQGRAAVRALSFPWPDELDGVVAQHWSASGLQPSTESAADQ